MEAFVSTVRTADFEMDYVRFGNGDRDFVIIPGLSVKSVMGSADAIADAYGMFAGEYTVWLFDRRKVLPPVYSVKEMAEDTAEAMTALGIRDADLFGASQGGMIALEIAIAHPELVRRMVLGSTASHVDADGGAIGEWIRKAEDGDADSLNEAFAAMVYSEGFYQQYKDLILAAGAGTTAEDLARFIILAKGAEGFDCRDDINKVSCPVLVLGAQKDRVLGPEASREIADLLGCELFIYEDYGHAVYDEAPDYKERILKFFHKA